MTVCIRLRRTGTKKKPSYRIVVADSRFPREGRFIEILGHYNPRSNPAALVVKEDRAKYWLGVGALPSRTVNKLFAVKGLMEPPPYRTSAPPRKAQEEKAAAAPAEETAEQQPPRENAQAAPESRQQPETKTEAAPETPPQGAPEA